MPHQYLTWIRHILFIYAFYCIRDPPITFTCDNKQCHTLDLKPSTSPSHASLRTLSPTIRSIPLRCRCLCTCASALLVSQLCTEFLFIIFQRAFNRLALPKKHHVEVRLIVSLNTQLISLIPLQSRELLLILLINCDHRGTCHIPVDLWTSLTYLVMLVGLLHFRVFTWQLRLHG